MRSSLSSATSSASLNRWASFRFLYLLEASFRTWSGAVLNKRISSLMLLSSLSLRQITFSIFIMFSRWLREFFGFGWCLAVRRRWIRYPSTACSASYISLRSCFSFFYSSNKATEGALIWGSLLNLIRCEVEGQLLRLLFFLLRSRVQMLSVLLINIYLNPFPTKIESPKFYTILCWIVGDCF